MATSYRTPGVYVEEISTFPPSIAPVETAIPAFIGYTETARETLDNDLLNKPKRISSMVEFVTFYGEAQPEQSIIVTIAETQDSDGNTISVQSRSELTENSRSKHILYYALQIYFANGGGPCWVISVGEFKAVATALSETELHAGLDALVNEDEPTLIVCPEAQSLSTADFKTFMDAALTQCANLQDRFAIMDLCGFEDMNTDSTNLLTSVATFRNSGIGANNLKYGAVYGPNIETTLDFTYSAANVNVSYSLNGVAGDAAVEAAATDATDAAATATDAATETGVAADAAAAAATDATAITAAIDAGAAALAAAAAAVEAATAASTAATASGDEAASAEATAAGEDAATAATAANDAAIDAAAAADTTAAIAAAEAARTAATDANDAANEAVTAANNAVTASATVSLDSLETTKTSRYQLAIAAIAEMVNKLPPSAAIAGVYAAIDRTRGVWKAPANTSLATVIQPTIRFSNTEQDVMNEDATSGKSVNAIRSFTGKGTLVWGARTLAGNDLEWKYINVRRFFNFVEESTKKATSHFVFESNDANTWVKVQAMIENFLTTLWRQGALQGAKPEHAFYVAVGLDKTMTALDILEGRMIVEIGLAAVRPAEFIILRFSHKLAES